MNHCIGFSGSVMNRCTIIMNSIQAPSPLLIKSFRRIGSLRCCSMSSDEKENDEVKDTLSGLVDEQVQELLRRKENKVLLEGLEKASQRVEMAKIELALIQKQESAVRQLKGYINQLEGQVFQISECQRDILEAKAIVEETERSLLVHVGGPEDGSKPMRMKSEEIDRDEERRESVRAASISALVGTFSGLPICFTQVTNLTQLLLPLAINFISCALFGVTFRYTIRRNLDDVQLKAGVAAAFGVVKVKFGFNDMEGEVKQYVGHWKGKLISANLPNKVELLADIQGHGCIKLFGDLKEDEFEHV